jgi:hypothetical protein
MKMMMMMIERYRFIQIKVNTAIPTETLAFINLSSGHTVTKIKFS